jgi:Ca2+-binding RTX toxin-like protein
LGDVVSPDGNNTITNSGAIGGSITLGGGSDKVTNLATGRIEGSITLGAAIDTYIGNATAETIVDEAGGDNYTMGGGNDTVEYLLSGFNAGANTIDGGTGVDHIDLSALSSGSTINLSVLTGQTDQLKNFENVTGSAGVDNITGSSVANVIMGNAGADRILGGGGADIMFGGSADLEADAVTDTFVFASLLDSAPGLGDIIVGFEVGVDELDFAFITGTLSEATNFTAGQTAGNAQWRETVIGGNTVLEINADADIAADMIVYLVGNKNLTSDDFVV